MPLTFQIDRQNQFVEIRGDGETNFDRLATLMNELIAHPEYRSHFSVLANFSNLSYVPSFLEIRRFSGLFQTASKAFQGKVGFIVSSTAQLNAGRFASVIARTINFQMQVFDDRKNALTWIFGKREFQMDQLRTKIYNVLHGNQLSALATVKTNGMPWVRYVTTRADAHLTIRFATPLQSRKISQLTENPNVHISSGATDLATSRQWVQVIGVATIKTDDATRKAFWSDFLTAYFSGPDDPQYAVVEIVPSQIEYFTMDSLAPEVLHL